MSESHVTTKAKCHTIVHDSDIYYETQEEKLNPIFTCCAIMTSVHHQGSLFGSSKSTQNSIFSQKEGWAPKLLEHKLDCFLPTLRFIEENGVNF